METGPVPLEHERIISFDIRDFPRIVVLTGRALALALAPHAQVAAGNVMKTVVFSFRDGIEDLLTPFARGEAMLQEAGVIVKENLRLNRTRLIDQLACP